jgi:HEAT repeat protein
MSRASQPGISDVAMAAAVELAQSSADPAIRRQIWSELGRTARPDVAQPLAEALLYDTDAGVRKVIAEYLNNYLDDPNVRAALQGAALGDASAEVRQRASWTLMSPRERRTHVERSLTDRSLSVAERMAPLLLSQEYYDYELDPEILTVLAEIASGNGDPAIRRSALEEFGRSARPEYLDLVIDSLHSDPDSLVREAALAALQAHRDGAFLDDDSVYIDALLDVVMADTDLGFRTSALQRLRQDVAELGVREALEAVLDANANNQLGARIEEMLAETRGQNR